MFGRIMLYLCGLLWAIAALYALARLVGAAWRKAATALRCRQTAATAAALALVALAALKLGGAKSGGVSVPDDYIMDAGSYLTNGIAHVAIAKRLPLLPDSTEILVYARELSSTNAADWFRLSPYLTYIAHPHDYALPNATNYNVTVYANYIPPSPVHTNGVWEMRGIEVPGHPSTYAFPNTKQETNP